MDLKSIIAHNLRELCNQYDGSIAQLCRQINITPQQFNNYLSAKHVPNEAVIAKICALFKISEDELYLSERIRSNFLAATKNVITPKVVEVLDRWKLTNRPGLSPGLYTVYFVTIENPKSILRSSMVVNWLEGYLTFRRFTSISKSAQPSSGSRRSDHKGLIIQQHESTFHLMAANERPNNEPSLITAQWAQSESTLLSGYAVIEASRGFTMSAVVIFPDTEMTLKQSLSLIQNYTWDDRTVPKSVKMELERLLLLLQSQGGRSPDLNN